MVRSVCQTLLRVARGQPEVIAVAAPDGRLLRYRELINDLVRVTLALEAIGVRAGRVVGLENPDCLFHLLMILACQAIGATSVSFSAGELGRPGKLPVVCDLLVAGSPAANRPELAQHAASEGWRHAVLAIPVSEADWPLLDRPMPPDHVVRILRTSGTTGAAKAVSVTAAAQRARLQLNCMWDDQMGPLRHASLYNFDFEGSFTRSCGALLAGGFVAFTDTARFHADIVRFGCNSATLLLGDAETLLASRPAGWARPQRMQMSVVGARLPQLLRAALLEHLTPTLDNSYSSNETGRVGMVDQTGTTTLLPGVAVSIVGPEGAPLALGEQGIVAIRSAAVARGYLGNPEADARHFRDGWFHSSDWGFQPDPQHLVVLGRADSMLNIGGRKIPAEGIEAELRDLDGVRDAAMVSFPGQREAEQLGVMLEVAPDSQQDRVLAAAAALLQRHGSCHLALINQLPRTETRKVKRGEIAAWFTAFDRRGAA